MSTLKTIMIRAWEIARTVVTAFGGKARQYLSSALKMAWKENKMENEEKPIREALELGGYAVIDKGLVLTARVCSGRKPSVSVYTRYDTAAGVTPSDRRISGSGMSGEFKWKLEENQLYCISRSVSYKEMGTCFISTFDGITTYWSGSERDDFIAAEMDVRFADSKKAVTDQRDAKEAARRAEAAARAADEARRDREYAEKMENRRLELEAEAERIAEEGQGNEDGLPDLTGSPKQIAWALKIRGAVARRDAKLVALKTATTAKYWIDNHKHSLAS